VLVLHIFNDNFLINNLNVTVKSFNMKSTIIPRRRYQY